MIQASLHKITPPLPLPFTPTYPEFYPHQHFNRQAHYTAASHCLIDLHASVPPYQARLSSTRGSRGLGAALDVGMAERLVARWWWPGGAVGSQVVVVLPAGTTSKGRRRLMVMIVWGNYQEEEGGFHEDDQSKYYLSFISDLDRPETLAI
ncbi:hypothetical protein M8C21_021777 [Ambrosia artemisiifolia]|uniref:Uncharacterized protein n=1 Tax=Ambrosia artemisiifolia TaxID=4212 RepID=A0AAD5DCG5_AMBAR|nr:hypothetical protein M8C21_021777 [Ambrosia artemisiifolia]